MLRLIRRMDAELSSRAYLTAGLAAPPFREAFIAVAPAAPGVYFLYRHVRVIYVGIAVRGSGIRQELERHLQGGYGPCTQIATSFDYQETRDPVVASREYLQAHLAQHGRLPCCNGPEG